MSTTFNLSVGNKGRVVVPVEVRVHRSWGEGTPLIGIETETGFVLVSRDDALRMLRDGLAGRDVVAELLAARRVEAAAEDAA